MTRQTFTLRLDEELCRALDDRVRPQRLSRNWAIDQAVRAWLTDGGAAVDETPAEPDLQPVAAVHKTRATARAASAGTVQGAQPPQPRHSDPGAGAPLAEVPHRHRSEEEVPDTRRGVAGRQFATFKCRGCVATVERAVRR